MCSIFTYPNILQSVSQIYTYEMRWLFLSQFWPLLKQASFFEAAGAVVKISSSQKQTTIMNFSLPKSMKRSVPKLSLLPDLLRYSARRLIGSRLIKSDWPSPDRIGKNI